MTESIEALSDEWVKGLWSVARPTDPLASDTIWLSDDVCRTFRRRGMAGAIGPTGAITRVALAATLEAAGLTDIS